MTGDLGGWRRGIRGRLMERIPGCDGVCGVALGMVNDVGECINGPCGVRGLQPLRRGWRDNVKKTKSQIGREGTPDLYLL